MPRALRRPRDPPAARTRRRGPGRSHGRAGRGGKKMAAAAPTPLPGPCPAARVTSVARRWRSGARRRGGAERRHGGEPAARLHHAGQLRLPALQPAAEARHLLQDPRPPHHPGAHRYRWGGGAGARRGGGGPGPGPGDASSPAAPLLSAAPARPGDAHEEESTLTEVRRGRAPRRAPQHPPPGPGAGDRVPLPRRKPSPRTVRMASLGGSSRQPGTAAAALPPGRAGAEGLPGEGTPPAPRGTAAAGRALVKRCTSRPVCLTPLDLPPRDAPPRVAGAARKPVIFGTLIISCRLTPRAVPIELLSNAGSPAHLPCVFFLSDS